MIDEKLAEKLLERISDLSECLGNLADDVDDLYTATKELIDDAKIGEGNRAEEE